MALKLVVESLRDEQPKTTVDKLMEGSELTIGRTKDNHWTLPFGSVSRKHCIVEYRNDDYFITDLNSLNGVYLNDQQLTPQTRHQLHDRDELRIGGCKIRVSLHTPVASSSVSAVKADLSGGTAIAPINPADLPKPEPALPEGATVQFSKRAEESPVQTNTADSSAGHNVEQPASPVAGDSGDEWNFLKEFEGAAGAGTAVRTEEPDPLANLDDLLPSNSARQSSAPADNGNTASAGLSSHSAAESSGAERNKAADIPNEDGDAVSDPPVSERDEPVDMETAAASAAASGNQSPAVAVSADRPSRQLSASADDAALLAAFLQGAGVSELKIDDAQRMMYALGETFQLIVSGMAESLQARRETKRAIKAEDMTQFGPIDNNPLKLPDMGAESIMKLLLTSKGGAYLSMPEAIRQGFDNLHTHQLGTMAGMRAALNSLLACFDPQQLEGELNQRSFLESIMPAARKAKYWDAYLQHYDDIAEQAEENFLDLIGDDLREQLTKVTKSQ